MSSEFALGGTSAVRAVGAVGSRSSGNPAAASKAAKAEDSVVERSDALDPGPVPIDTDRVTEVRRAIERGDYPIVPAKVADAIIAAGILLRTGQ
jgi:negative regulator of flagellin synthesis FlgM